MMDIYEIAKNIFTQIEEEVNETTKWKSSSKYIKIRNLQIDKRGSFGERLLKDVFAKERNISLSYTDGDQGEYDIAINGVKIEVKTASLDVNNKFQNEHIQNTTKCDYICFIGVAPDSTIADIDFSNLHNRGERGTGAGYKWDLKPKQMSEIHTREDVVRLFYDKLNLNKNKIKKNIKDKL